MKWGILTLLLLVSWLPAQRALMISTNGNISYPVEGGINFPVNVSLDNDLIVSGGISAGGNCAFTSNLDVSGELDVDGILKLGNTAVAETPSATHTLILKDNAGVSYRILCVPVP